MKYTMVLLFTILTGVCNADTIKVGVIDTGFDFSSKWEKSNFTIPKLCKFGHKDFTNTDLNDKHGHGTHIASLIGNYAGDVNYCIVSVKFYSNSNKAGINLTNSIKGLQYLINLKVDIINLSMGGLEYSEKECKLIKKALDNGIIVVAAGGNEKVELKDNTKYYPAMCDDRVTVVGNLDYKKRNIASSSNYNENMIYISGTDILGLGLNNTKVFMTGSSQSTAIYTGKLLRTLTVMRSKK